MDPHFCPYAFAVSSYLSPLINIKQPRRKSGEECMAAVDTILKEGRCGARGCEALAKNAEACGLPSLRRTKLGTLLNHWVSKTISGKAGGESRKMPRKIAFTSRWPAVCGRRDRPIRKEIIGHGMSALQRRIAGRNGLQHLRRTLALLHQPAREHRASILFKPLIEKRADLLAEIGGMVETREFVALQRSARSREKELPRWLGLVAGHAGLLKNSVVRVTRK
jgi:hypothetical protein